jgi:hypothetical protein
MASLRKISSKAATESVLLRSRRRCAVCYVSGNEDARSGAVSLLDRSGSRNDPDNLVFLCLEHHRQLDAGTMSTDVRKARRELYRAMGAGPISPALPVDDANAYERMVVEVIRDDFRERLGDHFALWPDTLLHGRAGVAHQLDAVVAFTIAGIRYLTIFEIRRTRAQTSVSEVLQFSAVIEDVGATKGVLVSGSGFSNAAIRLARSKGVMLAALTKADRHLRDVVASTESPSSPPG